MLPQKKSPNLNLHNEERIVYKYKGSKIMSMAGKYDSQLGKMEEVKNDKK